MRPANVRDRLHIIIIGYRDGQSGKNARLMPWGIAGGGGGRGID